VLQPRPETFPVEDCRGVVVSRLTAAIIAEMEARGSVRVVRKGLHGERGVARARLNPHVIAATELRKMCGARYSHQRETDDNIRGVWALRRIPEGLSAQRFLGPSWG